MARKRTRQQGEPEDPTEGAGPEPGEEPVGEEEETFEAEDPSEDLDRDAIAGEEPPDEEVGAELLNLKEDVERAWLARPFAVGEPFEGAANIVGVGIGVPEVDLESMAPEGPGAPTLNIYVAEPADVESVRAACVNGLGVHALGSDSAPVNVIVTGPIDAFPHRHRERPAPGGISVAHLRVTAGTLGCLARGRSGARANRVLMLSNNHVIANSNNARLGDSIVQPGPFDGGQHPGDRVAILERFVPIQFDGSPNFVDCATGWCWHRLVRRELTYHVRGVRRYFRISSTPRACRVGTLVGKSGRTTQLTFGRITDCNATIRVNFGGGRVALFRDQVAVRGLRGDFSRPGDSGSVIWSLGSRRPPVGLLFAGGGGLTFANKIGRVVAALDIQLLT